MEEAFFLLQSSDQPLRTYRRKLFGENWPSNWHEGFQMGMISSLNNLGDFFKAFMGWIGSKSK